MRALKSILCISSMAFSIQSLAQERPFLPEKVWISFDRSELDKIPLADNALIAKSDDPQRALVLVDSSDLSRLSRSMHEIFHRCGGFFMEDLQELRAKPRLQFKPQKPKETILADQGTRDLLDQIDEGKILATIRELSKFRNRYHLSSHGAASQKWIAEQWQQLAKDVPGLSIDLMRHSRTPQNSVRLIWPGSQNSAAEEIVVLGGHGDSIVNDVYDVNMHAPGADDNASGIATITEVIRVLAASGYKPRRSIHFFAYAAEEVGLWGSREVAKQYYDNRKNVTAVMQLDMTNFAGPSTDLALITDYTDASLTRFASGLLNTYLPEVNWKKDVCGYACSDHASWTRYGYRSVFPIESLFNESNPHIHSENDVVAMSGDNAMHAVPFAKLALAFILEQSR